MIKFYATFLFLFCISVTGQILKLDFENEDLNSWQQFPEANWSTDTTNAISGMASLHHIKDSNISAVSCISYQHLPILLDSMQSTWEFNVRYDYTPSSGNNWSFWLVSDTDAEEMSGKKEAIGYILGVNFTGSDDIVKLWKKTASGSSIVYSTGFNWQNEIVPGSNVGVRVERSKDGVWEIFIKTDAAEYISLGSASDNEIGVSEYFGIFYKYTSTQDKKLWVDDIHVRGFFYEDKEPPALSAINLTDRNTLTLTFSERIDTLQSVLFVLNRKTNPNIVIWRSEKEVELVFPENFSENNLLEIYKITDIKGNASSILSTEFNYYSANEFDIVINEIMYDPSPVVGLPEYEYLELFNRSNKPLNLNKWKVLSGNRAPMILPDFELPPLSYVVLCDFDALVEFPDSVNAIGIESFITLPNAGEKLLIVDRYDTPIHEIEYDSKLISNETKNNGGWSIELIDVNYPCIVTHNWDASISEPGGTPGFRNSISGEIQEYPFSEFSGIRDIEESSVILSFTEPLDSLSVINSSNYRINDLMPSAVEFINSKVVRINLETKLQFGTVNILEFARNPIDCAGNAAKTKPIYFGLPEVADSSDLLISEILFNASDDMPEFIEIYNNSGKVIDIRNYSIGKHDPEDMIINETKLVISENYQLFPDSFCILTGDKGKIEISKNYDAKIDVIGVPSFPSMPNDRGCFSILDNNLNVVDIVNYNSEMHFALLETDKAVSLERISYSVSGLEESNWHSASSTANYSTPGKPNSQLRPPLPFNKREFFSLSSNQISPDNDGMDDFLTIEYSFSEPGYICNISIYDLSGSRVRFLVNNILCEQTGDFIWEGLDDNRNRLLMGYYILFIEYWNTTGVTGQQKMEVLLLPEK